MSKLCTQYANKPGFKEALKVVGDFWTLRIVAVLESTDLRFCAIERALGDSNPATLTARLKKLEQCGVIERRSDVSGDTVYALTQTGADLVPVVEALYEASDKLAR